jgi:predicted metal-dependent RNase
MNFENKVSSDNGQTETIVERKQYFTVAGAWTKAGVSSCVHLRSQFEEILLDCGVNEPSTYGCKVRPFYF